MLRSNSYVGFDILWHIIILNIFMLRRGKKNCFWSLWALLQGSISLMSFILRITVLAVLLLKR